MLNLWPIAALAALTPSTSLSNAPSSAARAALSPLQLELPVLCTIGETCLIQKLVDRDSGPGRLDYRCGTLTTDGHDGIDFRLRTMAAMAKNVVVVAAAAGRVARMRDGEADISVKLRGDLAGRDAGNGVVIDHGNGWATQYSHLKRGSVRVKPGDIIRAGAPIGLIGMSGNTEFPHLHFTIRRNGAPVDPFSATTPFDGCSRTGESGNLWTNAAKRQLAYTPVAAIAIGFSASTPLTSVAQREKALASGKTNNPLILWADVTGVQTGDTQIFRIRHAAGSIVIDQSTVLRRSKLSWFAYSGRKAPAGGWAPGNYTGQYRLVRAGSTLAQLSTTIAID